MSKPNPHLKEKKAAKDVLENIVSDIELQTNDPKGFVAPGGTPSIPDKSIRIAAFNGPKVDEAAMKYAKERVYVTANKYLTEEQLEDPATKTRMELDALPIAEAYYQVNILKHGQTIVIGMLDEGDTHPRVHDALQNAGKSIRENIESLKKLLVALDNEYRTFRFEHEEQLRLDEERSRDTDPGPRGPVRLLPNYEIIDTEAEEEPAPQKGGISFRGNKELLMRLDSENQDSENTEEDA